MAGWHKTGDGAWTVGKTAYIGRSVALNLYGHLVTDDVQDFTVRFDFLYSSGDSGFFIRTG